MASDFSSRFAGTLATIARGLRLRLWSGAFLRQFPLAAALALVPTLIILWPAIIKPGSSVPLMLAALSWLVACAFIGFCLSLPVLLRRIHPSQAAEWLDIRQSQQDLFSAAWAIERRRTGSIDPIPGPFDQRIIDQAATVLAALPQPLSSLFPQTELRHRGKIAALSGGLCLALVMSAGLWLSFGPNLGNGSAELGTELDLAQGDVLAAKPDPETAKEQGRSLFPNDQRLADLATEAINRGDMNALQDLLDQAGAANQKLSDRIGNAQSEQRQPENEPGQKMGSKSLPGKEGGSKSGKPGQGKPGQDQKGKQSNSDRENSPQPRDRSGSQGENPNRGKNQPSKDGQSGKPNPNQRPDLDRGGAQAMDDGTKGGGSAPDGSAIGPADANPGQVQTGNNLLITQNRVNGRFEMFLGAGDARMPLTRIIPGSTSQALRALQTSQAPLQYERYVQSYFRALAQEVKP